MIHSFEPKDLIEVETRHGLGYLLYVTIYGLHQNDVFTVAAKSNGRIRHYRSIDVRLAPNPAFGINCLHEGPPQHDPIVSVGMPKKALAPHKRKRFARIK